MEPGLARATTTSTSHHAAIVNNLAYNFLDELVSWDRGSRPVTQP